MSEEPERRLKEHNKRKVKSTRPYVIWKIVMKKEAGTSKEARRLEKYYKSAAGKRRIKKIIESLGSLPD